MQNQTASSLQTLKTELDTWRTQQIGRKQIPQYFWDKAVELMPGHSITAVCRELRLDYQKLKKHLLSVNNTVNNTPPTFLELVGSQLTNSTSASTSTSTSASTLAPISDQYCNSPSTPTCQILIERRDGSKLTLHLPNDWLQIATLCNNFLRG